MNVANMVDEVARAVTATVSRSIAPLQRQLDDLLAWRKSVGEIRNGLDGAKGDPGVSGKDGDRGLDGRDGRDGTDGVGIKGDPGLNGEPGAKGDPGIPGKDGRDGINGKDANGISRLEHDADKHSLDIVMDSGEVLTLQMPIPKRGEKGEPGINGKDGADGLNGKDGANGIAGKDGAQGIRGEKGDVASADEIAAAVTKAVDALLPAMLTKAIEQSMPELVARASLLVPPPRDGLPGRPGTAGEDGKPGVSVADIRCEPIGKRSQQIVVRFSDGNEVKTPMHFEGMVIDSDVHRPGESYEKGDAVTHGGSYWIARTDTKATPGTSNDWRLAVKRGRDGKDAE